MFTFPLTTIIAGRYPWFPAKAVSISEVVTNRFTFAGTIKFSSTIVPAIVLFPLMPVLSPRVNVPLFPV
jgi:hypothetical protein